MRRGFQTALLGLTLSLSSTSALARAPYSVVTFGTGSFSEIQEQWEGIPDYLSQAQCGGWDMSQSVQGKIATVTGVPGHMGQWDGAMLSGMAKREDAMEFPSTAQGFTTDCWAGMNSAQKFVWRPGGTLPGQIIQKVVKVGYPEFYDPPCRWRINGGGVPPIPTPDGSSYPASQLPEPNDKESPELCANFCTYLNMFQYRDCLEPVGAVDPITGAPYAICNKWGNRYACSNAEVTNYKTACAVGSAEPSNAKACMGEQCRCQDDGGPNESMCVRDPSNDPYYSYYRKYTATIDRDPVETDVSSDRNFDGTPIPVACYGFYKEFDPKNRKTEFYDRRCVIGVDMSMMRDTQKGKAMYGESSNIVDDRWRSADIKDVDPTSNANKRTKRNDQKDIWFMGLGWGVSFLNEESFEKDFNKNLSSVFLSTNDLDTATMKGSWPVGRVNTGERRAFADRLRSFDDTGTERLIARWWQKQQTEVSKVFHPPVVRVLLPPGYSFGVDPEDPLFNPLLANKTDLSINDRSKRIEVQLDAREDILGELLSYIERSFLVHVEEQPVPVIVPSGSPTEFRAKADAWCTWYMKKVGQRNCDAAPTSVKNYIKQLESYADRIEDVRTLRSILPSYAGKIMQLQTDLTKPIGDWMKTNLSAYEQYLRDQQEVATDMELAWNNAQAAMSRFHDVSNMPFCMNQRFETPIYSLLDDWLPSRKNNGTITSEGLPNLTIPSPVDLAINLSSFTYMTGSLVLPVLKPISVRIDIEEPSINTVDGPSSPLPDFPDIATIRDGFKDALDALPTVTNNVTLPPLDLPVSQASNDSVILTAQRMTDVLNELNDRYDTFWKSVGPFTPEERQEQEADPNSVASLKKVLQCRGWNDSVCQHVEMDLMERVQRIASRKMVILREDLMSVGPEKLSAHPCLPDDNVCLQLHPEESVTSYRWQINGPKTMPDLTDTVRDLIRDRSIPAPIGTIDPTDFPPYDVDIQELLPAHSVPDTMNLSPDPPPS